VFVCMRVCLMKGSVYVCVRVCVCALKHELERVARCNGPQSKVVIVFCIICVRHFHVCVCVCVCVCLI